MPRAKGTDEVPLTIHVPRSLKAELKRRAELDGKTLRAFVQIILEKTVER